MLAVIRDGGGLQVILAATPETTLDGVYGLFFDGGNGHARIGRIVSYSPAERTVLREVEAVYSGDLDNRPPRLVERRRLSGSCRRRAGVRGRRHRG